MKKGIHLSFLPPDVLFVGADDEPTEGMPGAKYRRIPTIIALLLSPLMGGLFVALFPALIFVALITAVGHVISNMLKKQSPLIVMQGTPVASYLTREGEGSEEDELEYLIEEVQEARKKE